MPGTLTMKSDRQLQQDVQAEFRWDPRVEPNEMGVQVKDGVVTLTGFVDSYAKKLAARDAAYRVEGVLDVADDLQVRLPRPSERSDSEVAQAVRSALAWDVNVPDQFIRSTVANGVVTLEGEVDNWSQRLDATRAVNWLTGVKSVNNLIAVKPTARVDSAGVRQAIQEALSRQAEREAQRVQVAVRDGAVTLTGKVRSWAERNAVESAACFAPGVQDIDNRLTIDPYA